MNTAREFESEGSQEYFKDIESVSLCHELNSNDTDLRWLSTDSVPQVLSLRRGIIGSLEIKDYIYPEVDETAHVLKHLPPHGLSVGIFISHKLVAYTAFLIADGYPSFCRRQFFGASKAGDRVCIFSVSMVTQDLRNRGYQKLFIDLRCQLARRTHCNLQYSICSTRNAVSLGNLLKAGFSIVDVARIKDPQFGSLERFVLFRDALRQPLFAEADQHIYESHDVSAQRTALERGYFGACMHGNKSASVVYRRCHTVANVDWQPDTSTCSIGDLGTIAWPSTPPL